jgi:hypothetical protein
MHFMIRELMFYTLERADILFSFSQDENSFFP